MENEALEALNKQLRVKAIAPADADHQAAAIVKGINEELRKRRRGIWVASEMNLAFLEQYWEKEYSRRKIDKSRARYRLVQAIDILGPHSLIAPAAELQRVIDERCKGAPRRQRKVAAALNQMRKFFGITERLALEKKVCPRFRYLTESEFQRCLEHVTDYRDMSAETLKALFGVLFYSGVRTGEAFALKPGSLRKERYVMVDSQIDRLGRERHTKTNKSRRTILLKPGMPHFHAWVASEDRQIVRASLSRPLKAACMAAFPKRPDKWVCPHDLRHSFAVHCLVQHELSIASIAKLLGNSVVVCEEYYLNFSPEDEVLEALYQKTLA